MAILRIFPADFPAGSEFWATVGIGPRKVTAGNGHRIDDPGNQLAEADEFDKLEKSHDR
jgi:hypothetical protein